MHSTRPPHHNFSQHGHSGALFCLIETATQDELRTKAARRPMRELPWTSGYAVHTGPAVMGTKIAHGVIPEAIDWHSPSTPWWDPYFRPMPANLDTRLRAQARRRDGLGLSSASSTPRCLRVTTVKVI